MTNERTATQDVLVRPLVATDNADLLEDLLRLTAAAGAEPVVATTLEALRAQWNRRQVVLLGADFAASFAAGFVPRREGVILVAGDSDEASGIWRHACAVGAEQVALLPSGEGWLIDRIATSGVAGAIAAPAVGVVGGSGGVGASVLTAALALTADTRGIRPVAIDLDPRSAGLDVLLGDDTKQGLTWRDFAEARGRIRRATLRAELAQTSGIPHVTFPAGMERLVDANVVGSVIDALGLSAGLICVDVPRVLDAGVPGALCRLDLLVVVVARTTPGVLSAARLTRLAAIRDVPTAIVSAGPRSAPLASVEVGDSLGLPVLCELMPDSNVPKLIESARPVTGKRGSLAKVANQILDHVQLTAETGHDRLVA